MKKLRVLCDAAFVALVVLMAVSVVGCATFEGMGPIDRGAQERGLQERVAHERGGRDRGASRTVQASEPVQELAVQSSTTTSQAEESYPLVQTVFIPYEAAGVTGATVATRATNATEGSSKGVKRATTEGVAEGAEMGDAQVIYPYTPDAIYPILTAPKHITDIMLEEGEYLVSPPAAGDTTRWSLDIAYSGDEEHRKQHIYIKSLVSKAATNLILVTNKRVYHLELRSVVDNPMLSVSWIYAQGLRKSGGGLLRSGMGFSRPMSSQSGSPSSSVAAAGLASSVAALRDFIPKKGIIDYDLVASSDIPWTPIRAFSDGKKSYILFDKNFLSLEAPILYTLNSSGKAQVCNYRVVGNCYIVDKVLNSALLKNGEKGELSVAIKRRS